MLDEIIILIEKEIFSKDLIIEKFSRKFYGYLKSSKAIFFVNDIEVPISYHLKENDVYKILYLNKNKNVILSDKPIEVIYEDEYLMVVDKEPNLLTIPSKNEFSDSLYNRLAFHRSSSINIVTRLDKLTSGLVLISKKSYLTEKLKDNIIDKIYLTKAIFLLPTNEGLIDLPIKKFDGIKRAVMIDGKKSLTLFKLLDPIKKIYEVKLLTGRTHQIRVHFSYYGCSILNDPLYGNNCNGDLALICKKLKFRHPITNEIMEVTSKREW